MSNRHPRHQLLPAWIRFFSWLFLVCGALMSVFCFLGVLFNFDGHFMFFGLRYGGPMREVLPAGVAGASALMGYAGYALLWGRPEGRGVGLIAGYTGLAICVTVLVLSLRAKQIYIPLEPLLQVPFIIKLHRLKARWNDSV